MMSLPQESTLIILTNPTPPCNEQMRALPGRVDHKDHSPVPGTSNFTCCYVA